MVVSDAMAKALWPGRDAIGQCVRVNVDTMPCTYVVGIAENIKQQSLRTAAPGDRSSTGDNGFFYYLSAAQVRSRDLGLFVRVAGDAESQVEPVRRALQRVMPGQAYVSVAPFSQVIGYVTKSWELGATMFVAFGVLAVVLAAIGLYSVIAHNVTQRTHEMGVRIALGAHIRDVVTLILAQGVRVTVVGIVLGGLVALVGSRWVEPLLFDVSPHDPLTYGSVGGLLIAIAIAASVIPAWRAARVDPNTALRAE
jgi:ABC-type antimicrobial peptide transport system permease subunit